MEKYIDPEKMTLEQLRAELAKSYSEWEHLLIEGCSDPFWPDGVNMNLVRNHIIWWKSHIQAKAQTEQLSMFDLSSDADEIPIPPVVNNNYVAPNGKHSNRFDNSYFRDAIVHEI